MPAGWLALQLKARDEGLAILCASSGDLQMDVISTLVAGMMAPKELQARIPEICACYSWRKGLC